MLVMKALLALVLIGCATPEPGPHDRVACGYSDWDGIVVKACERACSTRPSYEERSCAYTRDGVSVPAYYTFVYQGVRGLCEPRESTADVTFYECDY